VKRGSKAFDIHENTYRIDADVVPTFEHRRYSGSKDAFGRFTYWTGVGFYPDGGSLIINWPQQTLDNGNVRHTNTLRRYKKIIRIIKRLRNEMQNEKIKDSENVASFLIESLVWNASVEAFKLATWRWSTRSGQVSIKCSCGCCCCLRGLGRLKTSLVC